ncbi:LOW QUALITY PROTEIN: ankyrin repeat domain-containing protein 33B [Alosa alosa]|uniref:LOW QUALITY PROTEIN: ankyrin repeat domain-containing protein 33B n=1 Tax=Alosa alosa TaxID=278164 RepID=UPI0020154CB9|nr:LOW QUALITY PROTEIN: ankyrin repeat domain-containing protein 33B [Alosa alosa]
MVLITEDRDGGGSPLRSKQVQLGRTVGVAQVHPVADTQVVLSENDHLGSYESEGYDDGDFEEYDEFSELPDTRSIASDDSFYPLVAYDDTEGSPESPEPLSLFQACCTNNPAMVKLMIRQGVVEEDVKETDQNNRTGLMVACYQGYVDVVIALSQCPHLDVNWQDKEGNTALITASQAGHITITNYLLNYFPGLDLERKNVHGFTALMKAAMQGRVECVRALMLAGANMKARDHGRKLTPREWALFTGRYDTAYTMLHLLSRPCPEQVRSSYLPEWPLLSALVAKAQEPKGCLRRLSDSIRGTFVLANVTDPVEDGALDHMVRITTSLSSPFISTACQTVCPGSPPCVGKRRLSVPEILKKAGRAAQGPGSRAAGQLQKALPELARGAGDQAPRTESPTAASGGGAVSPTEALRRGSLLPLHMVRRSSVRPGMGVPKLRVSKAPASDYVPEKNRRKSSSKDNGQNGQFLQIPKWRYKEMKEERKKAEEAEKKRQEAASRRQSPARKKK